MAIENKPAQNKNKNRLIFDPSIIQHREKVALATPQLEALPTSFVDMLIPIEDNIKIPIRMYTPSKVEKGKEIPTIFYVPGTGFVATETRFTHVTCSHICQTAKCRIVVINHRLAPENQFPIPYLDSYNVFKFFVKKFPAMYGIDTNQIAIVGYSSGGNIAALMTIKAMEEDIPVRKQILISPMVDFSRVLLGFKEYEAKDTDITEEFVHWTMNLYLPPHVKPKDPNLSPFWASQEKIKKLPSTDIIVAEYDRCRGDSEYYYLKLKAKNVPVVKFTVPGETHTHLWRNIEVTHKLVERIKFAFDHPSVNLLPHTFSYICLSTQEKKPAKELVEKKARL